MNDLIEQLRNVIRTHEMTGNTQASRAVQARATIAELERLNIVLKHAAEDERDRLLREANFESGNLEGKDREEANHASYWLAKKGGLFPGDRNRERQAQETVKTRWSFDDYAIGSMQEGASKLGVVCLKRPKGVNKEDWYSFAAVTCELLNRLSKIG